MCQSEWYGALLNLKGKENTSTDTLLKSDDKGVTGLNSMSSEGHCIAHNVIIYNK